VEAGVRCWSIVSLANADLRSMGVTMVASAPWWLG
jgi:hypothetical protein